MDDESKQVCTIRIMFPVESDEQAIAYKKKITEVLSPIPDSMIAFSLQRMANSKNVNTLFNKS